MPCYTSDGSLFHITWNIIPSNMEHEFHLEIIQQTHNKLREFGIRDVRYVNYRVVLVGEITIRFISILTQESVVFYLKFS